MAHILDEPAGGPPTWECPNCHQVFAPGTKKCDQCGKSGHELLWDMTRHMEIQVTRNGKGERYRITGVTGTSVLHADPLDKTEPAPPPARIYLRAEALREMDL